MDILIRAKSLGENSRRVKIFRNIIYVSLAVALPIIIASYFMSMFGFQPALANNISGIGVGILIVPAFIMIVILLSSVYPWINTQLKQTLEEGQGNVSDRLFKTIRRKSYIITAALVVMVLLIIANVLVGLWGVALPARYLRTKSCSFHSLP